MQTAGCDVVGNSALPFEEIIRFDESENATSSSTDGCQITCPGPIVVRASATGSYHVDDSRVFPYDFTGTNDLGGWMYLNMSFGESPVHPYDRVYEDVRRFRGALEGVSQNWVTVQMSAEGRYAVDFDAAYMGNGCSPHYGRTLERRSTVPHAPGNPHAGGFHIEPLPNINP